DERVALRGSERGTVPDSRVIGSPDPNEIIDVTVLLRRRAGELPPAGSARVSREEFAGLYGADPADVERIQEFAASNDLTVLEVDLARRSVRLAGSIANMNEAFGTEIRFYQSPDGDFRGRTGQIYIPAAIGDAIAGVFGLDERPQARTRLRRLAAGIWPRAAGDVSYSPNAVARLYDYPNGTGAGQTVAIIELGGGYSSADLKTYFTGLGLSKTPSVTAVAVDGATN